jgi:predicted CXXCH cytochrome family protein
MNTHRVKQIGWPLIAGLIVGIISLFLTVHLATAAPPAQDDTDAEGTEEGEAGVEVYTTEECQECHLDVTNHWQDSTHAHAYDDPYFQEQWQSMGSPEDCLTCHTTNFQPATGEFDAEGIACEACHGQVTEQHPPEPVPIKGDPDFCGTCHTTTIGEWHQTGHAVNDVGCMDCHDPHSQQPLFAEDDDLCINCHQDSMGEYLEDLHIQEGIGCVDCHALVIPPDPIPDTGIVPTGHAFSITPATCVACHTDALHAGFSLPGFEGGAAEFSAENEDTTLPTSLQAESEARAQEGELSLQQQVQALEAALASQNVTLLFQGGIVGLVLGGSTAWFVSQNMRSRRQREEDEEN